MTNSKFVPLLKILKITFIVILLLSVSLIVSACAHQHNFVLEQDKTADCENNGYKYYECDCGKHYTEEFPAVGHKMQYVVEGDKHYQKCQNDGCIYQTVKTDHNYVIYLANESSLPTCDKSGAEVKACVCGEKHTTVLSARHEVIYKQTANGHKTECINCNYSTDEVAHEYSTIIKRVPSTCQAQGYETKSCECGKQNTETLPIADHDYSKYVTDGSEYHWQVCAMCGAENEDSRMPHITSGQVVDSKPADCLHYAVWTYHCLECDQDIDYPDEVSGYGKHATKYFEAKNATELTDGNKEYWQCQTCQKYFTSKEGSEITWAEIVIPRTLVFIEDYRELVEAGNSIADGEYSYARYQFTFDVFAAETGCLAYYYADGQGGGNMIEFYVENAEVTAAMEGCRVTLNIRIYKNGDNVIYYAELINIESTNPTVNNKLSIRFNATFENDVKEYVLIKAVDQNGNEYSNDGYYASKYFVKVLNKNDVIHFEAQAYNKQSLRSLVINGKSYTLTNGRTEDIIVTEDITAEFIFGASELNIVTIETIDTSKQNANVVFNPYITYNYNGTPNEYGNRLYAKSLTGFMLSNSYIIRVEITYTEYVSNNYDINEVAKNIIRVGTGKNDKRDVNYSINSYKTVLTFDESLKYNYLEYSASASQARIDSVKIYYNTTNTFAK